MHLRPGKQSARIPPPRPGEGNHTSPTPQATPVPPHPPQADTLAKDAYALQAQIDHLAEQFEQLKAQLRQAQKLASIGTTAAMIAHEFNNLFTPVVAYAKQALDTDDVDLMRMALTKTLDRSAAVREMADRVIGLAKQPDNAVKAIKVREVVEGAIACLCRDLDKDNIGVNLQIDPELAVRANENQLTQVLFNLVINARQAMLGRRGRLTVDAAPTHDGRVNIHVRDTGCGIPPDNMGDIFEPFFSTKLNADKPDRRGLGLGLSICRDIIEDLGGTIDVASEVNVGTTFTLTLPQAE